jgi:hypothetical protein
METQAPICLECKKKLKGRPDKKFCSEECKNLYHNKNKFIEYGEIKSVILAIKKNRRILKKFFSPKKEKLIEREKLLREGFDFKFHTHHLIRKIQQNEFIFCADYGYREVEKDKYKIIRSF